MSSEAVSKLSKFVSWMRYSVCTDAACMCEWFVIQNALKLNEHLDANLTLVVNCRMLENEWPPVRFAVLKVRVFLCWKNRGLEKASTKFKQDIRIASIVNPNDIWNYFGGSKSTKKHSRDRRGFVHRHNVKSATSIWQVSDFDVPIFRALASRQAGERGTVLTIPEVLRRSALRMTERALSAWKEL